MALLRTHPPNALLAQSNRASDSSLKVSWAPQDPFSSKSSCNSPEELAYMQR